MARQTEMSEWTELEETLLLSRVTHTHVAPRAEWFRQQAEQALESGDMLGASEAATDAAFAYAVGMRVL